MPPADVSAIQTSMQEASNASKVLTEHKISSETSPDICGFLIILGAYLTSMDDMPKRRMLMVEMQSLVLSQLLTESTSSQPASDVTRLTSALPERWKSPC